MKKTLFDNINTNPQSKEPVEFSVSEISQKLKNYVEKNFSNIRVKGELSRITIAKSGHMYSSIKDKNAVLDIICWRGNLANLSIKPEEGLEVICTGRLTTYAGRSNYQMIIEKMELAGVGALLKMLEERKQKLLAEGLFAIDKKKPIPLMPNIIGVITSPTGAVIRDIMHRISDRFPTKILLHPVMVQGESAAKQVILAVENFNNIKNKDLKPDVIIIARGGGSFEDLMPFNDEELVRAVSKSKIPIISAIGHETDTSLIDYAADLRAPTPTAAAEKAVPVKKDIKIHISTLSARANRAVTNKIVNLNKQIKSLKRGLGDPLRLLENANQRLDQISIRLDLSLKNWINSKKFDLDRLKSSVRPQNINIKIDNYSQRLKDIENRYFLAFRQNIYKKEQNLKYLSSMLDSLSFKKTLKRGFVLVKDNKNSKTITRVKQLNSKDSLELQFYDGSVDVNIDNIKT